MIQLINNIKIRNLQAPRQRQLTFSAFLPGDLPNRSNGGKKAKNFACWQEMQVPALQASLEHLQPRGLLSCTSRSDGRQANAYYDSISPFGINRMLSIIPRQVMINMSWKDAILTIAT